MSDIQHPHQRPGMDDDAALEELRARYGRQLIDDVEGALEQGLKAHDAEERASVVADGRRAACFVLAAVGAYTVVGFLVALVFHQLGAR